MKHKYHLPEETKYGLREIALDLCVAAIGIIALIMMLILVKC